jgi:hypothetical protein
VAFDVHIEGLVRAITLFLLASLATGADRSPRSYKDSPEIAGSHPILWHDPGPVQSIDLRYGPGGPSEAPRPPFQFVKEDTSGTNPKILVRDAAGRTWNVKFGTEASSDTFSTRLAMAVGYFVEPNYFVESGTIEGVHDLKRAAATIDADGRFAAGARFQLRAKQPEYLVGWTWSWNDNPFLGTREFNGLRILTMLVSNWDVKDFRDQGGSPGALLHQLVERVIRGSNNAIYRDADGRYLFFIDDWGASMGSWGDAAERSKWDCGGFIGQSSQLVRLRGGRLEWGYHGIHTPDITRHLEVADVRWLLGYLGRLSDEQLNVGLLASGATANEAYCYTRALRMRIDQLKEIARGQAVTRTR